MRLAWLEAGAAACYATLYVGYLFLHPEGEFARWITLVLIPGTGLHLLRRRRLGESWVDIPRSFGISGRARTPGVLAAIAVGCGISVLQLAGRNGERIQGILTSGKAAWLLPASLTLMVLTAATTEEFFFRGILQKRLAAVLPLRGLAVPVAAMAFAAYHVPYALLTPGWGTQGDLGASVTAALATGLPLGLLLGLVFAASGQNLIVAILTHAAINSFPGMIQVGRLLGG